MRRFFWPLLALPGIWRLVVPALTDGLGFNPLFELLHRTGQIAVWLLIAVLALTPLKMLFPHAKLVAILNRHRRAIGVSVFIYGSLHVTEHFLYEGEFKGYLTNFWKPFFLTGTFAILVFALLGLTSNNFSVLRLGYPFWKWLHRLVYLAALALAWHVGTAGKGNWPFARMVFIPLLALQLLRAGKIFGSWAWGGISRWLRSHEWIDWREFQIVRRELESETIVSFYLQPVDGRPLSGFHPGQFLPIQLDVPHQPQPVLRTYTLSDAPNSQTYRLSINREPAPTNNETAPPGLVSNFFHDRVLVGARLRARPPAGKFRLNFSGQRPIVLLSAGVGITPMIAMLNALCEIESSRPVWFLHGARNRSEHAFGSHVRAFAATYANLRVYICYSQPMPDDLERRFCDVEGRLDVAFVKSLLSEPMGDFYLCGPGPFMKSLHDGLREWGVLEKRIHCESFGPDPVKLSGTGVPVCGKNSGRQVEFRPSGVALQWDGTHASLLDLALAQGLKLTYGCKAGVCGSCSHRLLQGAVRYTAAPAAPLAPGCALLCCATPDTDVVIEI